MALHSKNKNELLALVGAVYSFVAYLTAFTLEVLFIIDLVKQNEYPYSRSGQILPAVGGSSSHPFSLIPSSASPFEAAVEQARNGLESAQSYITIPCLALAILYFITFIGSLVLITGLILRSTLFLLVWICFMTTLCLPEFGLIIYVSTYAWGIETRNGQTELLFYLLRAALNVIFIHRTYRLFRNWSDEKNFFRLKSAGSRFSNLCGYDSPYFVGDSLTTTINPVFSSSTLNLDSHGARVGSPPMYLGGSSRDLSPSETDSVQEAMQAKTTRPKYSRSSSNLRDFIESPPIGPLDIELGRRHARHQRHHHQNMAGRSKSSASRPQSMVAKCRYPESYIQQHTHDNELNDDSFLDEFEMDLDYHTLRNQQNYLPESENRSRDRRHVERTTPFGTMTPAAAGLSYSTQSLDRRHLHDMDYSMPEQVILRPLGHQPFDYLHRLGSASSLASNAHPNLNTQPSGEPLKAHSRRHA